MCCQKSSAHIHAVKVRRGDDRRAVIVRTRKLGPDGRVVKFDNNACVLLNNKKEMLGTRISGPVSAELRLKGWGKIVSLAPKVCWILLYCTFIALTSHQYRLYDICFYILRYTLIPYIANTIYKIKYLGKMRTLGRYKHEQLQIVQKDPNGTERGY